MLRKLNILLKNSDRTLSNIIDVDRGFHNGIIRNHKFTFAASDCRKYGNYFLDASLRYLSPYDGTEGQLFLNAMYLAIQSLKQRDMRNYIKIIDEFYYEAIRNERHYFAETPNNLTRTGIQTIANGELGDLSWILMQFRKTRKKDNHDISTLETFFEDLTTNEVHLFVHKLINEFAIWINKEFCSLPSDKFEENEKLIRQYFKETYAKNDGDYSLSEGDFLLSANPKSLHSRWPNCMNGELEPLPLFNSFMERMKKALSEYFPNRRENIYKLFGRYIWLILVTTWMLNYSKELFNTYNKMNQIIVFEGADNLGKTTLINSLIENNYNKFFDLKQYTYKLPDSVKFPDTEKTWWSKKDKDNNEPCLDMGFRDKLNDYINSPYGPKLNFHGYGENPKKINYVQYYSKYKDLGENSIDARQFANLYNIIDCSMKSVENYFTKPPLDEITVDDNNQEALRIVQMNSERFLLQDRSVLSTMIYSLDRFKDNHSELNKIFKKYLYRSYINGVESYDSSIIKPRRSLKLENFIEEINENDEFQIKSKHMIHGPLDFLNLYEEMIEDSQIVKNSELHPGCANFINIKFVFLHSDSPFKGDDNENIMKKTICDFIPDYLESVSKQLNSKKLVFTLTEKEDELDKHIQNLDTLFKRFESYRQTSDYREMVLIVDKIQKLLTDIKNEIGVDYAKNIEVKDKNQGKDFWESSGIDKWEQRNQDYKAVHSAYFSLNLNAASTNNIHPANYSINHNRIVLPNGQILDYGQPPCFFEVDVDSIGIYNPKDYDKWELSTLIASKIF